MFEQIQAKTFAALRGEERRQQEGIELIPSENYTYPAVLELLGSVFTNKYSEGYPGRRYYGGQEYTDEIERLAVAAAKDVFRADHANVQPLSGSPMNQAVYFGLLEPGDTILAMDLSHGGHLTHGAPVSHMGRVFRFERYTASPALGGRIDYDRLRALAHEHRPRMILCGTSSYPLEPDYSRFKAIADEVGALTMADVSHVGGLIAANALQNPLDHGFDVMTTTSHKTLRGPRGGIILCRSPFKDAIDKSVFPGLQGGPHMNNVAGIAYTLAFAGTEAFRRYGQQVLANSQALVATLLASGCDLVWGRTENHLTVLNTMTSYGLNGHEAQRMLDEAGLTTNKQVVPDDPNPPLRPSGIRIGTPAGTTRGFGQAEFERIGGFIHRVLESRGDPDIVEGVRSEVKSLCAGFPVNAPDAYRESIAQTADASELLPSDA
jgi:glycine hydroxymethyltransferase